PPARTVMVLMDHWNVDSRALERNATFTPRWISYC
ncbi:MAG: hypothetical protein JWO42_178, partial [Chloroflexi bacterium]|nr:hypothetical protein [Chloroflexota bacterium]